MQATPQASEPALNRPSGTIQHGLEHWMDGTRNDKVTRRIKE